MAVHGRESVLDVAKGLIVHGSPVRGETRARDAPPAPTLLLVGAGGAGKSTVLDEIAKILEGQPHVLKDAATFPPAATVEDLLTALVFDFARLDERRWRFSRFLVGRLVAEMTTLDPADPARAGKQVQDGLARFRNPAVLSNGLAGLATMASANVPASVFQLVARALLAGAGALRIGRRITLRIGQDWYGHQDGKVDVNPIGELVALNQQKRFGGPVGEAAVTKVLFAAFLADIRAAAGHGNTVDPVLLLDNADSDVAVNFLRRLGDARFGQGVAPAPDRLTVVAAGTGVLPERLAVAGEPLNDAGLNAVRAGNPAPAGPWLTIALRDLSELEMFELAGDLSLPAEHRNRTVQLLRDLTCGHPGATTALMRAALQAGPGTACPREMLTEPIPDVRAPQGPDRRADTLIMEMMLAGLTAGQRADLAVYAAARTWTEADSLAQSNLLTEPIQTHGTLLSAAHWTPQPDGTKVMHPVLRTLLLQDLAARPEGRSVASWSQVFTWLADNTDDPWPHNLSRGGTGDTDEVARRFVVRLTQTDGRTWLAEARRLVVAPAVPTDWPAAIRGVTARLGNTALVGVVGRLITAWQAVHDPCAVAHRAEMHGIVATALLTVAGNAQGVGSADLVAESTAHQKAVALWQGIECVRENNHQGGTPA